MTFPEHVDKDAWAEERCYALVSPFTSSALKTESESTFNPLADVHRVLNERNGNGVEDGLRWKVKESMEIVMTALEQYGPDHVGLSFNGGKDCTLLLHILYAARQAYAIAHPGQTFNERISTLYVTYHDTFPEVEQFVEFCIKRYNLSLTRLSHPMLPALTTYMSTHPHVDSMLIGTRLSDPYSQNLRPFHPTDAGWPSLIRVHPILTYTYTDIWDAMRLLKVPCCVLYERGYTSLGGMKDTRRNTALRRKPEMEGEEGYEPAWMLREDGLERSGREKSVEVL
ncbi:hypothetical protein BC832DRAFT_561283 [Gaertneriomyces semiglobifer]|nr:hypothetical protein BC832DRAFT_561283 [Gaertneriomyces semiglobifer]